MQIAITVILIKMNGNMLENAYPDMHERIPDRVFTEDDFQKTDLPFDAREVFDILCRSSFYYIYWLQFLIKMLFYML